MITENRDGDVSFVVGEYASGPGIPLTIVLFVIFPFPLSKNL